MPNVKGQDLEAISERVKSSLLKTRKLVSHRKKVNSRLLITSMVFSASATLVAGVTSAGGPLIGSGIEGWRLACIAAAVLGLISTLSTGISQQLDSSSILTDGKECLIKLLSLDLGITTGRMDGEEVSNQYQQLALLYPELID